MAEKITMPRLSDTMEEGTVVKWHKNVGDKVSEGDILAEIETDKAIQEFESEYDGVLLHQGIEEGKSAKVDSILAIIGEEGEDIGELTGGAQETSEDGYREAEKSESIDTEPEEESQTASEIPDNIHIISMPRLSDTMEEGTVAKWHKSVGDEVKEGDILADIETDKAVQEFESEFDGNLLHIGAEEGKSAPVDTVLAIIGPAGTDISGILNSGNKPKSEKSESPKPEEKENENKEERKPESPPQAQTPEPAGGLPDDSRIFASPLARSLAKEKGIDLRTVSGTGDNGRIIKKDIESYKPKAAAFASQTYIKQESSSVANSQMRKVIAKRLAESKFTAPHYYLNVEVDMDNCISSREQINKINTDSKISFNDIIVKACALVLRQHPRVNSSL